VNSTNNTFSLLCTWRKKKASVIVVFIFIA